MNALVQWVGIVCAAGSVPVVAVASNIPGAGPVVVAAVGVFLAGLCLTAAAGATR